MVTGLTMGSSSIGQRRSVSKTPRPNPRAPKV